MNFDKTLGILYLNSFFQLAYPCRHLLQIIMLFNHIFIVNFNLLDRTLFHQSLTQDSFYHQKIYFKFLWQNPRNVSIHLDGIAVGHSIHQRKIQSIYLQ